MFIALPLIAVLSAMPVPKNIGLEVLQDRSFEIMGWFCSDVGCEQQPRIFDDNITFVEKDFHNLINSIKHESFSWSATLDCVVSHDRLKVCKLVDNKPGHTEGANVAMSLAEAVHLSLKNRSGTRAIIAIDYEVGGCPRWFCVVHPYGLVVGQPPSPGQ
jgi:hypothetical protein